MRRKAPFDKALDAVLRGLDEVGPEQRHEVLAHAKRILDRERKRASRAASPVPEQPPQTADEPPAQQSLIDAN